MSRSTGTSGPVARHSRRPKLPRFTIRTIAAVALLLSVAGGASLTGDSEQADLAEQRDRLLAGAAADNQAEAFNAEQQLLQRLERTDTLTDRGSREQGGGSEVTSRAEQPETKPEPEPEPAPAEAPAGEPSDPVGPVPASCGEYSGNRATGCALLLDAGFSLDQMSCLDNLWNKESGWNELAQNPSSGAYGIPQALPGSKMATAGDDWQTNPATQVRWGLSYIEDRYGTPCAAWQHSQANNWY